MPLPTVSIPRRAGRWLGWTATALALAVAPLAIPTAHAAPDEEAPADPDSPKGQADALSDDAVQKFYNKEYEAAIDLFLQAYELDQQPNYLFNIGRVYEESGDLVKAVEFYERFVASPGVDLDARQNATERLKVLRSAVDALKKDDKEPAPAPGPEPEPEPIVDEGPTEDPKADRKKKLRIAGYSLLGVGGAALIVGGVFGGLARGKTNDADNEPFVDDALNLRAEAKTQAVVADAMFISGGVLAATGLVLVLSTLGGRKQGDTARQRGNGRANAAVWTPFATTRSAGLSVSGRF